MLRCYLMDPDTDVCQTEQPQISYSVDFTAEQSSAMGYGITYSILLYSIFYWIGSVLDWANEIKQLRTEC